MFKLIKTVVKGAITTLAIDWVVQRFTGKSVVADAVQSKPAKKKAKPRKKAVAKTTEG